MELPFPSKSQARDIIIAHLDYYRLDHTHNGTIKPFTEEGMDALLGVPTSIHPRKTLARAANVIQYAVDQKLMTIDAECVKAAATDPTTSVAEPDFTEGIDGAS